MGGGGRGSAFRNYDAKNTDYLHVKIVIIYVLLSFLDPFSCDLLSRRMFAEALLECYKSLGPVLPMPFL